MEKCGIPARGSPRKGASEHSQGWSEPRSGERNPWKGAEDRLAPSKGCHCRGRGRREGGSPTAASAPGNDSHDRAAGPRPRGLRPRLRRSLHPWPRSFRPCRALENRNPPPGVPGAARPPPLAMVQRPLRGLSQAGMPRIFSGIAPRLHASGVSALRGAVTDPLGEHRFRAKWPGTERAAAGHCSFFHHLI